MCWSIFIAGLLISVFAPVQADEPAATANAVDAYYNHLKTLKAEFTEIYSGPGVYRTESGVLWLKKPGHMRWDYRQPKEKVFVTDGKTAYFYVPGENQARKTAVKNIDDIRSPLRYLLGKTKLEKELEGLSLARDLKPLQPGNVVLRGVPHGMKERVSEVVMEIAPEHRITRIVVHEVDGVTTEFRFSGFEENAAIQDAIFQFTPPPGVEVLQSNQVLR